MQYWSFCDLWRWFALVAKTTFSSTEWFRTRSQNFQTRWARGYFFLFTSQNNIYSITLDVNANVIQTYSNFVGPRPFQIQPWYHSPASFEEGGLPIKPSSLEMQLFFILNSWRDWPPGPRYEAVVQSLSPSTTLRWKIGCSSLLCFPVRPHFLVIERLTCVKDREEVLSKAKLLKRSNIYVSEDLSRYFSLVCIHFPLGQFDTLSSRKTREHRHELQKFLRQVLFWSDSSKSTK